MNSKGTPKQTESDYESSQPLNITTLTWSEVTTRSTLISRHFRCEDCFLSNSNQFNANRNKQTKELALKLANYTLKSHSSSSVAKVVSCSLPINSQSALHEDNSEFSQYTDLQMSAEVTCDAWEG